MHYFFAHCDATVRAVDWSNPQGILTSRVTGEIAFELCRATGPVSGRALSRAVGRSEGGVRAALRPLVESGLVRAEGRGNAIAYAINRGHLAYPAVSLLADPRAALIDALRRRIRRWDVQPAHACLFGSAARGDGGPESDVDVLVVRPARVRAGNAAWQRGVDSLGADIESWTGNFAAILDVGERRLASTARLGRPIIDSLRRDGVLLAGAPLDELLGRDSRAA